MSSGNITYQLLDENCILRNCLHGGPIDVQATYFDAPDRNPIEVQQDITPKTTERMLKAMSRAYGGYGVMAVDDAMVVGQLRFFPGSFDHPENGLATENAMPACILGAPVLKQWETFDTDHLPDMQCADSRTLVIQCFQVVHDYKATAEGHPTDQPNYLKQGIGTGMLKFAIDWARKAGFTQVKATAIAHIKPLMMWSCQLSVERYRQLGFQVSESKHLGHAALSQRRGDHGQAVARMWDEYAHLSDEQACRLYDVVLPL